MIVAVEGEEEEEAVLEMALVACPVQGISEGGFHLHLHLHVKERVCLI